MAEWKRIFRNRRLCVGLLLIFLLNGFLFVREQVETDFGLDYTLPQASISISTIGGSYEVAQETVDSHAALTRYLEWLEEYKKMPLTEAIPELETEKERLTDILAISDLLKDDGGISMTDSLTQYREEQPELVKQLENGEIDLNEVRLDYVAVNNLLAQTAYLDGYDDYLNTIHANKDKMLSFSIFNDTDSFSGRNIILTA